MLFAGYHCKWSFCCPFSLGSRSIIIFCGLSLVWTFALIGLFFVCCCILINENIYLNFSLPLKAKYCSSLIFSEGKTKVSFSNRYGKLKMIHDFIFSVPKNETFRHFLRLDDGHDSDQCVFLWTRQLLRLLFVHRMLFSRLWIVSKLL